MISTFRHELATLIDELKMLLPGRPADFRGRHFFHNALSHCRYTRHLLLSRFYRPASAWLISQARAPAVDDADFDATLRESYRSWIY